MNNHINSNDTQGIKWITQTFSIVRIPPPMTEKHKHTIQQQHPCWQFIVFISMWKTPAFQ